MSASECTTASPAGVTPAAAAAVSAPAADRVGAPWRAPLELTMLGAIWGGSFLFMRVAPAASGPLPLVEARLSLGALILLPLLWAARARFSLALWLRIAGIAAINSVIPFALFAWAAERAPAGIGAISNAMTVMFTALVAFLFFGERIGPRRLIGLVGGFVGVAILASGKTAGESVWPAGPGGTAAPLCYCFGIKFLRRHLSRYPPRARARPPLLRCHRPLAPLAIYNWPHHPIGAASWASALLLGV